MNAPDLVGPVYGWRLMHIRGNGVLVSPQRGSVWPVDGLDAKCLARSGRYCLATWCQCAVDNDRICLDIVCECLGARHVAPHGGCNCGIHSLKHWWDAIGRGIGAGARRRKSVLCKVEISGRYIEGDDGWRTEHAKVVGIVDDGKPRTRQASQLYRVPLLGGAAARKARSMLYGSNMYVWWVEVSRAAFFEDWRYVRTPPRRSAAAIYSARQGFRGTPIGRREG